MSAPLKIKSCLRLQKAIQFGYRDMVCTALKEFTRNFHCSKCNNKKIPNFIDYWTLQINGGTGGQGLAKFGGIGGDGGNVIVKANKRIDTLKPLARKHPTKKCRAVGGSDSSKFHLIGKPGSDVEIKVPVGVLVHTDNGKVVDLDKHNDEVIVARGGKGGNPKTNFLGIKGDSKIVGFELKLLADVGLVGFPNAGKSSFLRAVSRSKTKIGAYPFTTLSPQLGLMEWNDGRRISVADLPGIVQGSNKNFGKGFKFLRHAERNRMLLFVLDVNPFQLGLDYPERSAFETLLILLKELDIYGKGIMDKPAVLAINKIDTDPTGVKTERLIELVKNLPDSLDTVSEDLHPASFIEFEDIIKMSALNKVNTEMIMDRVRTVIDEQAELKLAGDAEAKYLGKYEDTDEQLTTTFV